MNTAPCTLLLAAIAGCALAQTLSPELAPIAAKYKADIAALDAQQAAALTQAQNPYVAALGSAERIAITAGNVAGVSAITTERAALSSGLIAPRLTGRSAEGVADPSQGLSRRQRPHPGG